MSRPICVECKVEYSCAKNEVLINDPAARGFPPTYWYADRWECPGCKHQVIVGRGKSLQWDHSGNVPPWASELDSSFEFNHNLPTEEKENVT